MGYVVNYTAPRSVEDYVHRVGRTARKGYEGIAVTFLDPSYQKDRRFIAPLVEMLRNVKTEVPEWLEGEAENRRLDNTPEDGDMPSDAEDVADLGIFNNAGHEFTLCSEWPLLPV